MPELRWWLTARVERALFMSRGIAGLGQRARCITKCDQAERV